MGVIILINIVAAGVPSHALKEWSVTNRNSRNDKIAASILGAG